MRFSLYALAALAPLTSFAAPVEHSVSLQTDLRNGNRITQVARGSKNKYSALCKAFERYAVAVPPAILSAANAASLPATTVSQNIAVKPNTTVSAVASVQSGSVAANPEANEVAYLSPVTVGRMNMNLDFDTGSSDLWVFTTDLPQAQQGDHALYMHLYGTLMPGLNWTISYGDGSQASGNVYSDRVVVGGVTATAQAVEAATSVSASFVTGVSDGLLGLGFGDINQVRPTQVPTFMDNLGPTLPQDVFTVALKDNAPGEYDFGFVDQTAYTGDITYVPVNSSRGYWSFAMDSYAIGDAANPSTFSSSESTVIADSGTSINWLPTTLVTMYYNQISGAQFSSVWGGMTFPCDADLPDLHIYIGGQPFTIAGKFMNYAPASDDYCFGGIQDGSSIGFSILGDVFLKAGIFAVFDRSVPQIGFATQT